MPDPQDTANADSNADALDPLAGPDTDASPSDLDASGEDDAAATPEFPDLAGTTENADETGDADAASDASGTQAADATTDPAAVAAMAEDFAAFAVPAASVATGGVSGRAVSGVSDRSSANISNVYAALQSADADGADAQSLGSDDADAGTLTDDLAELMKNGLTGKNSPAAQGADKLQSSQVSGQSAGGDASKPDMSALTAMTANAGGTAGDAAQAGSASNFSSALAAGMNYPAGSAMSPSGTLVAANLQLSQMSPEAATAQAAELDELGLTIASKTLQGSRQFQIQLDPPELGRVEVKLSISNAGTTHAALIVDKPQTLHMLQQDAQNLARTLQEAGVDLAGGGLSFSLRNGQSDQDRSNEANGGDSSSIGVSATAEGGGTAADSPILSLAPDSVRLDIRV